MRKVKLELSPYPYELNIYYGKYNTCKKELDKFLVDLPASKGCAGYYLLDNRPVYYIYLDIDRATQGTLAHELIHITWYLNEHVGLNIDSKHDEQQTYLVSYLMDLINKKIDIKKVK